MQKLDFTDAVDLLTREDSRFDRDAYFFLREALDFSVAQSQKQKHGRTPHVSGQQLLEGIRLLALKRFGPMVPTVFEYWGVRRCEDFGRMVYSLIHLGVFGRSDTDSLEDFKHGYSFEDAFHAPFLPKARLPVDAPETPSASSEAQLHPPN
ncbi:MAG: hypothetical protein RLZZ399_940 [Verrucomicrobiota bacterium]|jgi:uncharacterized repeat protein (TIGR04138 family)